MLAQVLFVLAAVAIFGASAVAGIAGAARAQTAAEAKALIVPALETALGAYQRSIAATIAAQIAPVRGNAVANPAAVPALEAGVVWPERTYVEAAGGASALRVAVDVLPTAQTVPACDAAGSGPDSAIALQCSPFVQESRVSLTLTGNAGPAAANGVVSPLAHGRYTVTLRLFAQPPYAIVSGVNDAAAPGSPHEGDTAGWAGALGPFGAPLPDDTTIHVVYACTPGTGACTNSNPAPADDPTATPWTNGN